MTFRDLSDPQAVIRAIGEFDRIGREAFLAKYRFGEALAYFVNYEGTLYDSKPIVAVAMPPMTRPATTLVTNANAVRAATSRLRLLIAVRPLRRTTVHDPLSSMNHGLIHRDRCRQLASPDLS